MALKAAVVEVKSVYWKSARGKSRMIDKLVNAIPGA